ncbi:MAG: sugar phosphate isomerase/epimerase [Candidatus Micrarchaeota archaeon]|nr:sugar phosphate isomerase/epimerase [Candidatus Micrarchaeota archaeon]
MIIGAMNSPKRGVVEEIALFGEMGFDFVEITLEPPAALPERVIANRKAIVDVLHSYNFGVLAHCPWYFSVAHPYERVQKAIVEEFKRAFEAAAALGAKKVTAHTEWMPPGIQERAVMVARTIETVGKLRGFAAELGLELLVENAWASSFSIREFKRLFSEVDVGLTLDVGHASTADGEGVENYLREFRRRIGHVHLHDNDGKRDQHLPLGAGKADIGSAIRALKAQYDGTITLEIHSEDRDYLRLSKDKLEIAWFGKRQHEKNKEYAGGRG